MKYEYKTLAFEFHDGETVNKLNALGADGWELVGLVSYSLSLMGFFKREVK